MNDQWYLQQDGQTVGPLAFEELRYLFQAGRLTVDSLVRRADRDTWQPFGEFKADGTSASSLPTIRRDAGIPRRPSEPADEASEVDADPSPPLALPPLPTDQTPKDARRRTVLISCAVGSLFALLLLLAWMLWQNGPASIADSSGGGNDTAQASGRADKVAGSGDAQASTGGAGDTTRGSESIGKQSNKDSADQSEGGTAPSSGKGSQQAPSSPDSAEARSPNAARKPATSGSNTPLSDADDAVLSPVTINAPPTTKPTDKKPSATAPSESKPAAEGNGSGGQGTGKGGNEEDGEAKFFGIRAKGKNVAYVVDCSSSMRERSLETGKMRFETACDELRRSIKELKNTQKFFVSFFSHQPYPQFVNDIGGKAELSLIIATDGNKKRLQVWTNGAQPGGGTDPRHALKIAFELQPGPDVIYLLTDGEFDPGVLFDIQAWNKGRKLRIPIHTIAFVSSAGEPLLQEIAKQTGGKYRFVP